MLQVEDERHPTFLENRLVQGMEAAAAFQLQVFGLCSPTEQVSLVPLSAILDN